MMSRKALSLLILLTMVIAPLALPAAAQEK